MASQSSDAVEDRWYEAIGEYEKSTDSDLFLYSGPIEHFPALEFTGYVGAKPPGRRQAALFLTTYGGDPHSAYRIARVFQDRYESFRILVGGPCKSAGTLVAIGASEVVFGVGGELGPLDVQVTKPDEFMPTSSGLDAFEALAIVTSAGYDHFEDVMLRLLSRSSWEISTRTAAEIATQLVSGLFGPISAQIDPYRLGEISRAMSIATAYGKRLQNGNLKEGALTRLVEGYPAHPFAIDAKEAATLFQVVEVMSDLEAELADHPSIQTPSRNTIALDLGFVAGERKKAGAPPAPAAPGEKKTTKEKGKGKKTG